MKCGDSVYNVDEMRDFLRQRLSKKRFIHSLNVADECQALARVYDEDEHKCYFAGLIHDVCKEIPAETQREMVLKSRFAVSQSELSSKPLWHAIAGAWYAENVLEVTDNDILKAVRFHTVGRAGMKRIEEIVYLADLISADRTYKDVKKMKKLAYTDLNLAMFEALKFSISSVLEKGGYIPNYSAEAYNQYAFLFSNKDK